GKRSSPSPTNDLSGTDHAFATPQKLHGVTPMATATANKTQEQIYEWEGKARTGKLVRGEMRAGGEALVGATLRRQGILVQKVKRRRLSGGGSIKPKDIAIFTRQLATMMKAGVPLLQSFDIVARGS